MFLFGNRQTGWTIDSEGGAWSPIREGKRGWLVRIWRKIFQR